MKGTAIRVVSRVASRTAIRSGLVPLDTGLGHPVRDERQRMFGVVPDADGLLQDLQSGTNALLVTCKDGGERLAGR
jgi:hypothetical protein